MAIRSVGFQLRTDGKAEVKNDFREVRDAGAAAFDGVADAAETAAQRSTAVTEQYTERQIAAFRKQATAAKLAVLGQANQDAFNGAAENPSGKFAATVNLDRSTGGARRSAGVFEEAAAIEAAAARAAAEAEQIAARAADERAASAMKLRAIIDPLSVATARFAAETQSADSLQTGAISVGEHSAALAIYRERLTETERALNGTAAAEATAARAAAEAEQIAERAADERAASVMKLRAMIDPLSVATARFAAETQSADSLLQSGAISVGEHSAAFAMYRERLTETERALNGTAAAEATAARAAAEAEQIAARAADERAASVMKLRATIDPLSVAQQRFDAEIATANGLMATGAISTSEHAAALAIYQQRLDETRRALDGSAQSEQAAAAGAAHLLAELNPAAAAQDRLNRELVEYLDWSKRGLLTTDQLADAQFRARKRYDETTDAIKRQSGAGGGFSANQKQTLLYTASDIVGSSANGVNPAQLLIQQGPQVLQAFAAEEGGLAKLRATLTGTAGAVAAVAAAAAVGTLAWLDYSTAMTKLEATSRGTGRLLGLSGEELERNAEAAASAGKMSISAARDIEAGYLAVARSGDVLLKLTGITKDFAAATGQDVAGAQKVLAAAFADPIKGAEDLTRQYGILSQAQIDRIAKMVEEGDQESAHRVLLDALYPAFAGAADGANLLARGWDSVRDAASNAFTWMGKAIDRMITGGALSDKIKDLEQRRDRGPSVGELLKGTSQDSYRAALQKEIDGLRYQARQDTARVDRDKQEAARAAGSDIADRYTGRDQLSEYRRKAGTLRAALRADIPVAERDQLTDSLSAYSHAIDTFIPKQEKANQLAAIDAKIAATKSPGRKAELATERSRIELSGQVIDSASAEAQAISRGERARAQSTSSGNRHAQSLARQAESMEVNAAAALDVADAYLKSSAAGGVAEARRKAMTDATRKGIDVDAQMRRQLNLQIADGVAAGAKSVAQMRDETTTRAAANDNLAAGKVAAAQFNQELSDEAALRPLIALRTIAQSQGMTEAYSKITRAIDAYRAALIGAHAEESQSGALQATAEAKRNVEELKASIIGLSRSPAQQAIDAARRSAARAADDGQMTGDTRTDFIDAKVGEARAAAAGDQARYILDTLRGQQDSLALSRLDLQLAGASSDVRDAELTKLREVLTIRRSFPEIAAEDVKAILAGIDAQAAVNAELKITAAAIDEVRGYGNQFVDDVLSADTWSSWGNAGKTVLNSLKTEFIKLALLNPLKNLINGNNDLPTLASAIGNIGSLFGGGPKSSAILSAASPIGSNATGNANWSGGLTYVNENGAEIADLPNGTRIYPAGESRRMMQAANDVGPRGDTHIHVHAEGAVLTETIRGWVAQGIDVAAARGAAGGAAMGEAQLQAKQVRKLGKWR